MTSTAAPLPGLGIGYHRSWWGVGLRGLLAIALGVFILARPLASAGALALLIAIWALVVGFVEIARAFDLRRVAPHWWVFLIAGIVSTLFGVAALYYYPGLSLSFAVLWVAWWLLATGTLGIVIAVNERRHHLPWGWTIAWGLLSIVAGIAALVNPPVTLAAILGLLAGFALLSGVLLVAGAIRLRGLEHHA